MPNTFLTPLAIARDAAITLSDRLVLAPYVSRATEQTFANKVGDTVKVTIPVAVSAANEFTSTTSPQNITQREADVVLQKHFEKSAAITSKELSLELDEFTREITTPFMAGISMSIDAYTIAKLRGGFARNLVGSVANRPSTEDHIIAGEKALDDLWIPKNGRVGLVDTTSFYAFRKLDAFKNALYGGTGTNGNPPMVYDTEWVADPNSGAFARGDIGGSITGTGTAGASTLAIASLSSATGTIKEGFAFTIDGDTTRYVVTADATIASNAATVSVYPVLATSPNGAAITAEAAGYSNMIFVPQAAALAVVAPAPLLGGMSAIATYNGISVRVSYGSSTSTLISTVVYDVFVGAKVTDASGGVVLCG